MLDFLFGKVAEPETKPHEPVSLIAKEHALFAIINNYSETHVRIFDRDLEPRVFARELILQELGVMLALPHSSLEVFTTPETLAKFAGHPHPFIDFVRNHSYATLSACPQIATIDMIWGSQGKAFIQTRDCGLIFHKAGETHHSIGMIFDRLSHTAARKSALSDIALQP